MRIWMWTASLTCSTTASMCEVVHLVEAEVHAVRITQITRRQRETRKGNGHKRNLKGADFGDHNAV